MKLYSTRGHSVNKLNKSVILGLVKKSKKVVVLSAYYSVDFIYELVEAASSCEGDGVDIKLVFNGFSGRKLKQQKEELMRVIDSFECGGGIKSFDVLLNFKSSLFHTKLYKFMTGTPVWMIGSANFSTPAYETNEELLLEMSGRNDDLDQYMENILRESIYLLKVPDPTIDTLIKFFRLGSLYYKPKSNIQFNFSNINIPSWVDEKLMPDDRPRHTDPGEAWGAFNLKRALEINNKLKVSRVNISKWYIETTLGFWVPDNYDIKVNAALSASGEKVEKNLLLIKNTLDEKGDGFINGIYSDFIKDIYKILHDVYMDEVGVGSRVIVCCKHDDEYYYAKIEKITKQYVHVVYDDKDNEKIPIKSAFGSRYKSVHIATSGRNSTIVGTTKNMTVNKEVISSWSLNSCIDKEFWLPTEATDDQFDRYVEKIVSLLNNENYIERRSRPLLSTPMPEIWLDEIAYKDFSDSFFGYIVYRAMSDSSFKKLPTVVRSMLLMNEEKYKKEDVSEESVKNKLVNFLKLNAWSSADWE